jgi:hypothetical protein
MPWYLISTICAGLFAGAALYINLVEHPARLECGPRLAVRQFIPSYRRATVMQASLALLGSATAFLAWLESRDGWLLVSGILLGSVVPFTLIVIFPTNKQLLDPGLDVESPRTRALLSRWAKLHAVRSTLSALAFFTLLAAH